MLCSVALFLSFFVSDCANMSTLVISSIAVHTNLFVMHPPEDRAVVRRAFSWPANILSNREAGWAGARIHGVGLVRNAELICSAKLPRVVFARYFHRCCRNAPVAF